MLNPPTVQHVRIVTEHDKLINRICATTGLPKRLDEHPLNDLKDSIDDRLLDIELNIDYAAKRHLNVIKE